MKARILTGSKQEIAANVAHINGDVREAIVFVDDPLAPTTEIADIFGEMDAFLVQQPHVDDSRKSIYARLEDE